jgi:TonB family protein
MTPLIHTGILAVSSSLAASLVAKATVAAALGLTGAWLARRSRAAVRHALLSATFGVLLALPVASLLAPPVRIAVSTAAAERMPALAGAIQAVPPAAAAQPTVGVSPVVSGSAGLPLSTVWLSGWIAGTALFLLPVAMGLWQVRSLRRAALAWRQGQPVVDGLAADAGIHRRVEVLLHGALPGPMTCGVVHPAIVLPEDAQIWEAEDLTRAIVHELEHVKRGDWAGHCLARAVCALYWFHPLVWMAWRRLALEAERSCDDAVLGRSEATAYADQLVGLARRLSAAAKSPLLAMASRADLAKRVEAALDGRQRRGRAGALPVALACAAAAVLVLTMSPLRTVAAPQFAGMDDKPTAMPASTMLPAAGVAVSPQSAKAVKGLRTMAPLRMVAVAQSDASPAAMPRFSADTRLVIVDVTVTDNAGNSIDGLTPRDFVIAEDGVTQHLSVFEFQRLTGATNGLQSYYILGYYTPNTNTDATFRKIQITVIGNASARLEHRTGYWAGKTPTGFEAGTAADSASPGFPLVVYKKDAEYAEEARKAKYQGTVVLTVTIDDTGAVTDLRVSHSVGLGLDEKAIEAVKQWKFKPGMKDGKPVAMQARVDVSFRLW